MGKIGWRGSAKNMDQGVVKSTVRKTGQGARALGIAVARATSEPERAGYLLAAGINVTASFAGSSKAKSLSKPVLMPLLSGRVLRSRTSTTHRAIGIAGLTGGWLGDLVLMRPRSLPQGAAGFSLNHLAYCTLLWHKGARPKLGAALGRAVILAAATGFAARTQPRLAPLVLAYGGLLATTSTLADDPSLHNETTPASFGLSHGGNLFLVSDAVLCVRELLLEDSESSIASIADGIVMSTYTLAQLLLVDGLFSK